MYDQLYSHRNANIRPQGLPKTIICCFDGTGNRFGENSNIVRLLDAFVKDKPSKQVVYYQPGIGTYSKQQHYTSIETNLRSTFNETLASSLHDHVKEGYVFIMQNYKKGDKICLFGFSRGAYIARVLMGMMYKVGLLPANNIEQVKLAYTMYEATDELGYKLSQDFKRTYSTHVIIDFVGVWDTVASVGLFPSEGRHPYTSMNYATKIFRHALALDERRIYFQPLTWDRPTPDAQQEHDTYLPDFQETHVPEFEETVVPDYIPPERDYTDTKEVWFAGCHADVGGGSHHYRIRESLSNISLRWMIEEVEKARCGVAFNYQARAYRGLFDNNSLLNWEGEIIAPIHDQLSRSPMWWILECLPLRTIRQNGDGCWVEHKQCNFGAGRFMPFTEEGIVLVHSSVAERIQSSIGYKPAASNWMELERHGMIEYVD